jgi:hypothetical protein
LGEITSAAVLGTPEENKKGENEEVHALGKDLFQFGNWRHTIQTKDAPSLIKAYWVAIFVQVDGSWKERLTCYNLAAPLGDRG